MRERLRTGSSALVGLVLATSVLSSECTVSCPTALLSGQLVEVDGTLDVKTADGQLENVDWSKYSLRRDGDDLVVTDFWGTVLAREGDVVNLGGGEGTDKRFKVCAPIVVVVS